jgi:uncharacterized tellurite resistance protein B-like protein
MSRDHLRSLVQLYLAVAYRPDRDVDARETEAIASMMRDWLPPSSHGSLGEVMEAAVRLEQRGEAMSIEGLVRGLKPWLSDAERTLVFGDLDRIAWADGERSEVEAGLIALAREAWGAPATASP